MKNCYILKDYSKEKKIVACKVCGSHKKVKITQLNEYVCCDVNFKFEKDYDIYRNRAFKKGLAFRINYV